MEFSELREKINKLQQMSLNRGATQGEEDAACVKIGRLVMKYGLPVIEKPVEKIVYKDPPCSRVLFSERLKLAAFTYTEATDESEKAIQCLFAFEEGPRYSWFPKTQIANESEVKAKGDYGTLIVTEWIAKQKKYIE